MDFFNSQLFPISEIRKLEKASIQLSLTKRLFRFRTVVRWVINELLLLNLNNLSQWKLYGCFFQFATFATVANWSCQWIFGCTKRWRYSCTLVEYVAIILNNILSLLGLLRPLNSKAIRSTGPKHAFKHKISKKGKQLLRH